MGRVVLLFLVVVSLAFSQRSFRDAQPEEIWAILDSDIAVMRTPETQTSRAAFDRNLVTVIGANTQVEILETTGWLSVWHKVNMLSNNRVTATGWILTGVVKNAKLVSRPANSTTQSNWGSIRYPHSAVNVRAFRNSSSKIVAHLKTNQKVKVDFMDKDWWAVFDPDEGVRSESKAIGFVYASLLFPDKIDQLKKESAGKTGLPYKIVQKEDQSYQGVPRMTYRVVLQVTKLPDENLIKEVARSIWNDGNKSWKEFTIFFYLPEMATDDMAYGIANFSPKGLDDFSISEIALMGTKWE